jgi:hypothetical protein
VAKRHGLRAKQERFAVEYAKGVSATQAASRPGVLRALNSGGRQSPIKESQDHGAGLQGGAATSWTISSLVGTTYSRWPRACLGSA